MEKRIVTIKPHSFIDVITNSSTELFACNTDKTIEMVKEVLNKIVQGYNMMADGHYSMDMFEEPWIFNLAEYRKWRKNYDNEPRTARYSTVEGWFSDDESDEDMKELRMHYINHGDNSGGFWSASRNPYHHRIQDTRDEDGRNSYDAREAEAKKIYAEIEAEETKPDWWITPWKHHHNPTLVKELDGCTIITGSDDNSIPYNIWDIINNQLSGNNYHLG